MSHVAVTLETEHQAIDLALPMNVPSRVLAAALAQSLNLSHSRGQHYILSIKTDQGLRRIPPNASLGDMAIVHGMYMVLTEGSQQEEPLIETGAGLRAENGTFFPLKSKATLIGRNDPKSGIFVDIDLTSLVSNPKIISRRHAQIEQEGDRFYITDLGSTNGTKLNDERLTPREKKPLWDGDVLEFGKNGARLIFQGGKSKC